MFILRIFVIYINYNISLKLTHLNNKLGCICLANSELKYCFLILKDHKFYVIETSVNDLLFMLYSKV